MADKLILYNGGWLMSGTSLVTYDADANPSGPPADCCCPPGCCPTPPTDVTMTLNIDGCPFAAISGCTAVLSTDGAGCAGMGTVTQCWNHPAIDGVPGCGDVLSAELACVDGAYAIRLFLCNVIGTPEFATVPLTTVSCDPFHLTGSVEIDTDCCTGTLEVDITE